MPDDHSMETWSSSGAPGDRRSPGRGGPPLERVGAYRLRERLGEGGFGIVYLAEQTEPVRRRVALKVIKPGMDSQAVLARFEAERQALAVMDHPCIARIFDGGTTDQGRAYFAMELVQGESITTFCDKHRLTVRERIELFLRVCEAVQHAHNKGVIHRDLKPANILVHYSGEVAMPKIIDFGVAKALHQKLSDSTVYTHQGQLIGTPEYMSPEQAEMSAQDIDTRSDVYSLGAVLYELLSGAKPFASDTLRSSGIAEIQRIIREIDPPTPSARVAECSKTDNALAEQRRTEPRSLISELRDDLDWIVMRCLEKDRARRYETAHALAMDLQRALRDEPVEAGPPSLRYRCRKFVRRNRVGVSAAIVVGVLLCAGLAGTGYGLVQARKSRAIADHQAALARARAAESDRIAAFQAEQIRGLDLSNLGLSIRERLLAEASEDRRAQLDEMLHGINFTNIAMGSIRSSLFESTLGIVESDYTAEPLVQASLYQGLAETMLALGLLDDAEEAQTRALTLRRANARTPVEQLLRSVRGAAAIELSLGRVEQARAMYHEALERATQQFGEEHPETILALRGVAECSYIANEIGSAIELFRRAHELNVRAHGPQDARTLQTANSVGWMLYMDSRPDEAERWLATAREGLAETLGPSATQTIITTQNLAEVLAEQGKFDQAEPYYREAVAVCRSALGDEHPITLTSVDYLGSFLQRDGRYAEALPLLEQAMDARIRTLGERNAVALTSINNLGWCLYRNGDLARAEPLLRRALSGRRSVLGERHRHTLLTMSNLALLLVDKGEPAEALSLAEEASARTRDELGSDSWWYGNARGKEGRALAALGRFAEAEAVLLDAAAIVQSSLGAESEQTRRIARYLADLYDEMHGREPDAGYETKRDDWLARAEAS